MAYLHCHGKLEDGTSCGWSQDDFWQPTYVVEGKVYEGYTPLRSDLVAFIRGNLFKERVHMDLSFFEENPTIPCKKDAEGFYCYGPDLAAWELESKAKKIRGMLVRTEQEFKEKRDELVCPRCGQQKWDID